MGSRASAGGGRGQLEGPSHEPEREYEFGCQPAPAGVVADGRQQDDAPPVDGHHRGSPRRGRRRGRQSATGGRAAHGVRRRGLQRVLPVRLSPPRRSRAFRTAGDAAVDALTGNTPKQDITARSKQMKTETDMTTAIDARQFRKALGSFTTGVTIVTTQGEDGKDYGLTAN